MLFSLISFFGGFLASSLIDTSLGEFSEWAVVGSSILVATVEGFNAFYFSYIPFPCQIRDDSGSDASNDDDEEERPLTLDEIKAKALRGLERRSQKHPSVSKRLVSSVRLSILNSYLAFRDKRGGRQAGFSKGRS